MTFSIAAHDGDAWGVAVASKFLAVGSVVPAVRHGIGAVATQALARVGYHDDVLDALSGGASVADALGAAVAADERRDHRQVGAVGPTGASTFTGSQCLSWAGGVSAGDDRTAYAIQGNILTGPEVVEAMEAAWLGTAGRLLDERLIATLLAGDDAGGDSRGRQSAASSRSPRVPATTAAECSSTCGSTTTPTPPASWPGCTTCRRCSSVDPRASSRCVAPCATRWRPCSQRRGHGTHGGDVEADLEAWMSQVNLETRHSPGGIDVRVLAELRAAAAGGTPR